MDSNIFTCPCCSHESLTLSDYLCHHCESNFTSENCTRMDIFTGPPAKRRCNEPIPAEPSSSAFTCLGSAFKPMTLDSYELFPHSPRRIQPEIEIIDLSSDEENEPLDLSITRSPFDPPFPRSVIKNTLPDGSDEPLDLSIVHSTMDPPLPRLSVIRYAPTAPEQCESVEDNSNTPCNIELDDIELDDIESVLFNAAQEVDPVIGTVVKPGDIQSVNDSPADQHAVDPTIDCVVADEPVSDYTINSAQPASRQFQSRKGKFACFRCGKSYVQRTSFDRHQASCGMRMCTTDPADVPANFNDFKLIKSAFARYYLVYRFVNTKKMDLISLFSQINLSVIELLRTIVKKFLAMKYYFTIECIFHEEISGKSIKAYFTSGIFTGLLAEINSFSTSIVLEELSDHIDQFTQRGSGWTLSYINHIDLMLGKFIPHKGGCDNHQLPERLKKKKCLISPATETDCFMFSVLIGLHPAQGHRQRVSQYSEFINDYDFSMVRGIVPVSNIVKFERVNRVSVNLYTFEFETEKVVPMKIVNEEEEKHVNLFLHGDHYFYINDMNRLANTSRTRSRFICHRCLSSFRLRDQLSAHKIDCCVNIPQRIVMPSGNQAICKRWNFRKEIQFPFCIYADFETLSVKHNDGDNILTDLVPCSYGYVVVDWTGKIIHHDFYLGSDVGKKFLMSLKNIEDFLANHLEQNRIKDHNLSPAEEGNFKNASHCHICHKELSHDRVRDHDHLTGLYRGAAHQKCNLDYRLPDQYPVVFHNLKNFDGHIIINALDEDFCEDKPRLIAHSTEKYIGFFARKFKFMDSFAFLSSSLDNLSMNISNDQKNNYLRQIFDGFDTSLLLKKSALPYEYLTSLEVFDEPTLPSKSAFHSSLSDSEISDEMYKHIEDVWDTYDCKSLKDLHNIYLKVDVLLLAAVFENFRGISFSNFELDPLHQFSAPGLTWAAALKRTRIELELITDVDMLLMIERSIRGGPTIVMDRHVKANNKYLPDYDPSQPSSFLLYLDVNNLYGYAMSEKLPVSGFAWSNVSIDHVLNTSDDSELGYILEVDLEYPPDLHDLHNDFPLAPEKVEIKHNMYSPYQQELLNDLKENGFKPAQSTKLVTSFTKKERYVIHYRTLKFYVRHGIIVSKVHRTIEFHQSAWLADYVQFCTSKRQSASSDFEKDFYKLLVNSIYGKTIEDKRKHRNVEIALRDVEAQRHLRKNHCQKFVILDDKKMLFWMKKMLVKMDKPIAIGFTVLELAKLKMYELHYDTFKAHYENNISLVYTDTDSLIYRIQTQDIVKDLHSFSSIMDFSNYPRDHPLYSNTNNKKIGYLKDELGGKQLVEFIGIRPKLYAFRTEDDVKKRAKGVPRPVLKNKITFDDYLRCLYEHQITREDAVTLRSVRHNIHMVSTSKIMLSPLDDKRYWLDRLSSLAYGHYKIDN